MDIDMDEVYVSFTYSRPTYAQWTVIARASDSSEASISKTGGRQYGQHGHTPRVNTPIIVVAFRRARCARAIDVAVAVVDDSLSRVRSVDSRPRRRLWTVLCARTPMLDARGRRRRRHRRRRNPWALATIAACIPNVIIASTTGANDDGRRLIEYHDKGLVTIDVGRSEVLIEGTSERARGVVVRGYSRNAVRRAFDATTVTVVDRGGFVSANCALYHSWRAPVFNATTNATSVEWRHAKMTAERERDESAAGVTSAPGSTIRVVIGPYEKEYVISPRCRARSSSIKYAVRATSAFQQKLVARLVVGVILLVIAPTVASSVTCFYTIAMTLSTFALALIVLHRISRAIPGGRMVKRTTAIGGLVTYYLVPTEHWNKVMDMYLSASIKPIKMIIRLIQQRYANLSLESVLAEDPWALYGALAGIGLLLLGAAVGRWLVKSFIIDAVTGGVASSVRGFVTMFIRIVGCALVQFSSRDVPIGTALACVAATYCLYAPVARTTDRVIHAAGNLVRSRGQAHADVNEDESDDDFVRERDWASHSDASDDGDGPWRGAFGARRRKPLPESLDPEPRTPPKPLLFDDSGKTTPIHREGLIRRAFASSKTQAPSPPPPARPPIGAAAAAYGRFLSQGEHHSVGALKTANEMDHLTKSPEFAAWLAKNAHRIRLTRAD